MPYNEEAWKLAGFKPPKPKLPGAKAAPTKGQKKKAPKKPWDRASGVIDAVNPFD